MSIGLSDCPCMFVCMRVDACVRMIVVLIHFKPYHTDQTPHPMGIFSRNSQIRLCAMNIEHIYSGHTHIAHVCFDKQNFEFNGKLAGFQFEPLNPKWLNFNVFSSFSPILVCHHLLYVSSSSYIFKCIKMSWHANHLIYIF